SYFTVACSDSSGSYTCPTNGTCAGNKTCNCVAGYTPTNCSGQPCNGSNCPAPNWWCQPNVTPACGTATTLAATACNCADGRQVALACGTAGTCEYACKGVCDVVSQNCATGTDKCTVVLDSPTGDNFPSCVPPTG